MLLLEINMIDLGTSRSILSLAGQGSDSKEIAAALEIEEGLVNIVLGKHGVDTARDISDDQLDSLRGRAYSLAMQNEDLGVAARMVSYLIDRDKPKQPQQTSQIVTINNEIKLAMAQVKQLAKEYETTN